MISSANTNIEGNINSIISRICMNNAKTEPPVLRENFYPILLQQVKNHHITSVKKRPRPGTY
jgi:hypothetical protein